MSVLDHLASISAGLVSKPALCPGAGTAERSPETLYISFDSLQNDLYYFDHFITFLKIS
jgi:hypothetical protein